MRFTPSHVLALLLTLTTLAEAKDQVANSVVKIYVTRRDPDFLRPWNKANPQETGGSGVIIDGKRVLTNAHVVLYASQIFVQADQTTERVPAKATFIAPGIDLAIVEVEKPSFFDDRPAAAPGRRHPRAETNRQRLRVSDRRRANVASRRGSSRGSNAPRSIASFAGCEFRSTPR